MPIIFKSNYVKIVTDLELPSSFYQSNGEAAYKDQIKLDSERTRYVSLTHTTDEMKEALRSTAHLEEDDPVSYTQGSHDGGVFSETIAKTSPIYRKNVVEVNMNGTEEGFYNCLRFAYTDDASRLCGFSLSSVRDDSNPATPVPQRPHIITIVVIKDVTLPPEKREVLLITQPSLVSQNVAAQGKMIQANDINKVVFNFLNSKGIAYLLEGLFTNNSFSANKFAELSQRIQGNRNIDDRDPKLALIYDLYPLWVQLSIHDSIAEKHPILRKNLFNTMQRAAFDDINFFKCKTVEDVVDEVKYYENLPVFKFLPELSPNIKTEGIACIRDHCLEKTSRLADVEGQFIGRHQEELDRALEKSFLTRYKNTLGIAATGATLTTYAAPLPGLAMSAALTAMVCKKYHNEQQSLRAYKQEVVTPERELKESTEETIHENYEKATTAILNRAENSREGFLYLTEELMEQGDRQDPIDDYSIVSVDCRGQVSF